MNTKAIIGLDGLARTDTERYDFGVDFDTHEIVTVANTCPSWNAIFTGKDLDDVDSFWKWPTDHDATDDQEIGKVSNERFKYEDVRSHRHLWERFDDVDVVSAPVALPTYSNVDDPPGLSVTWPAEREEIGRSIDELRERTLQSDRVITVFPEPDKCNHLRDNDDKDYDDDDRDRHLRRLVDVVDTITSEFHDWVFISDHGLPTAPGHYPVDQTLWVPVHEPVGLVASNAFDPADVQNNRHAYGYLVEFLKA